jgi:hypothetical protein
VLAFCSSDPQLRREATIAVRGILAAESVRVIPQNREGFLDGLALYEARPDKGYSLADCISMWTMRREGLTDVLTNDRHFEQEGFRTLFSLLTRTSPQISLHVALAFGQDPADVVVDHKHHYHH